MTLLTDLKLFATHPHECSYLKDQSATTLFVDPDTEWDRSLYSQLLDLGFRRSGDHVYRPHCANCQACIPSRIPVEEFNPSRSQRRTWRKNSDLSAAEVTNIDNEECYQLYERYITLRHHDGDMFPPSRDQYRDFLGTAWLTTRYIEFRDSDHQLKIISVMDELDNGLSAIYNFFDPQDRSRGLGNYIILWQIEETRLRGLRSLYLGYWIDKCDKMSYKIGFRPVELRISNRWVRLN